MIPRRRMRRRFLDDSTQNLYYASNEVEAKEPPSNQPQAQPLHSIWPINLFGIGLLSDLLGKGGTAKTSKPGRSIGQLISPFNLYDALSILGAASSDATREQLQRCLRLFDQNGHAIQATPMLDQLHQELDHLNQEAQRIERQNERLERSIIHIPPLGQESMQSNQGSQYNMQPSPSITYSNYLLIRNDMPVQQSFAQQVKNKIHLVRFSVATPEDLETVVRRVNATVKRDTRGMIPSILDSGSVSQATTLVLLSTLYFYGRWLHPFSRDANYRDLFNGTNSKTAADQTYMEHGHVSMPYYEDQAVQILEMPYDEPSDTVFGMVLPKKVCPGPQPLKPKIARQTTGLATPCMAKYADAKTQAHRGAQV